MKLVIVSPHRDDAAFSLGLSLEHWLAAGHTVQVLNCFTQSTYAPYSDAASLHANDRVSFVSATRKREDAAWNKRLGRRLQITDLDLLDAPLRLACEVDEVLTLPIRAGDRALARVAGAIAKLARNGSPESLAILLPLAVGSHIDHRVTREAGLQALAASSLPVSFYEDLPYAARLGGTEQIASLVESTAMGLQPAFAGSEDSHPELAEQRKRRMAECYDSQIDTEIAGQIAAFCLGYGGRERLWANAAWCASALVAKPAQEASA